MKKSVIFYYSGTGNTWYVANKMKHYLSSNTGECEILSIENLSKLKIKAKISEADIIGFGYPIYASDIPDPMKKFMQKITIPKNKDVFIFCTQYFFSGDGARVATEFLNVNKEQIKWAFHFNMPNNLCCIPLHKYTSDFNKINETLKKANKKIKEACIKISRNEVSLIDFNMQSKILGNMQRPVYRKFKNKFTNKLSIDYTKCTSCGICESICPTANIVYKNSKYVIKPNCVFCMRCYNFCPNNAILFNKKPRKNKYGTPYKGPTKTYIKNLIDSKRIEKIKKEQREIALLNNNKSLD